MPQHSFSDTDQFMATVKRLPVLTREEETRLATEYVQTKHPDLRRQLVEGHLRLVVKIAHECRSRHVPLQDLIQEGCLGLMKAVEKYDPTRGVRLPSYAAWWIRAYIFQYIMTNSRVVRVATTFAQRKLFFSLRREQARMQRAGLEAAPAELAKHLGVAEKDVVEMSMRLGSQDVQFDTAAAFSSKVPTEFEEALGRPPRPDEEVESHDLRQAVREKVESVESTLEKRDRFIFEHRLMAEKPLTLQELGKRCGISRERARQLEERLKSRLRAHFESMVEGAEGTGVEHARAA
jgi:RNA polymerase sigma-32 factor